MKLTLTELVGEVQIWTLPKPEEQAEWTFDILDLMLMQGVMG
jgi:hypothetical protein